YAYRHRNIDDYIRAGARRTLLLRSYFIPEDDFPEPPHSGEHHLVNDIAFVGHFEDDGRLESMRALATGGLRPVVFGTGWPAATAESGPASLDLKPPVYADRYRRAVSGAKIALTFLSRINQDTYTRRTFQIPAMGTFQLSEYTPDLATLFTEGRDIEF